MKRANVEEEINISYLPNDILKYLTDFLSPCSYYIVTAYTRFFRFERKDFNRGEILDEAVISGNIKLINLLLDSNVYHSPHINILAATYNHQHILEFLLNRGYKFTQNVTYAAARHNHFNLLKWLLTINCPYSEEVSNGAAKSGSLEMIKWLNSEGYNFDHEIVAAAVSSNNFLLVKWLHNNNHPLTTNTFCEATSLGDMGVVQWLYDNKCPWISDSYIGPIQKQNLDLIIWLYDKGCPLDQENLFSMVGSTKNRQIIQWFRGKDFHLNFHISRRLCLDGNLKDLQFWMDDGRKLDYSHYKAAILMNQLEIIKYLYSQNCPLSGDIFTTAIIRSNIDILEWLFAYNCPHHGLFRFAVMRGDTKVFDLLHHNNIPIPDNICEYAINLESLKWFRSKNMPWDNDVYLNAIYRNDLAMAKWAHETGCPIDILRCYERIGQINHITSNGIEYQNFLDWLRTI